MGADLITIILTFLSGGTVLFVTQKIFGRKEDKLSYDNVATGFYATQFTELSVRFETLYGQIAVINERTVNFQSEITNLKIANNSLKAELNSLRIENERLHLENGGLKNQLDVLLNYDSNKK